MTDRLTIGNAPGRLALLITQCPDPLMWYSNAVRQLVPFVRVHAAQGQPTELVSREGAGYTNIVRLADCRVLHIADNGLQVTDVTALLTQTPQQAATAKPACSPEEFGALLAWLRLLEQHHPPDGWPAVQMRDLSALLDRLTQAPVAVMDTRNALGLCAPTEADFPALHALQGHRVALVDMGPAAPVIPEPLPCRYPSCQFVGCPPGGCHEAPNTEATGAPPHGAKQENGR